MGDAGGAVLVAARIAPVGVALGVADEDRDVGLVDMAVHDDRIAGVGGAEVDKIFPVFAVVVEDLVAVPEFVEQGVAQDATDFGLGVLAVQAVGADEEYVFFLYASGVEFLQDQGDGDFPVRSGLFAPFHSIRKHDDRRGARVGLAGERFHADGIADAAQGFFGDTFGG